MSAKLWIEFAHRMLSSAYEEKGATCRTLTTEEHALALMACGDEWEEPGLGAVLRQAWDELVRGAALDGQWERTIKLLVAALPAGRHLPWALLQFGPTSAGGVRPARLADCDAPALFLARRGEVLLPPVMEEEAYGRLLRRGEFEVRDGDHLAIVSEHYVRARGGVRPWSWRVVAVSIRRLIETGCNAGQLADALIRWYALLAAEPGTPAQPGLSYRASAGAGQRPAVSVLAMRVRPMRTATVWSGPPSQRALDSEVLRRFIAETDMRIICGDTTAEIAARLLGADLVQDPPPDEGWREVPPTSRLTSADGGSLAALVAEGVVTMRAAIERLAAVQRPQDLARRQDGASRLARLLLTADQVHFLVGEAVNPAQTAPNGLPLRLPAVEKLVADLRTRGKIVSVARY